MSKVITFSTKFPSYHPKAGQPTYFVEKIWKSFETQDIAKPRKDFSEYGFTDVYYRNNFDIIIPKHHTIRLGNRWNVGDKFSPRAWSGKPYNSKQIIIAQDIEIKKTWNFEIDDYGFITVGGKTESSLEKYDVWEREIANNDGLEVQDFCDWFLKSPNFKKNQSFNGQIICWNEDIKY